MDDSRLRFGVGVLVVAAIGVGIILTFLFGAFPTVLKQEYALQVWFPSAEGVNTNSPVLRDGVKIGRVVDIMLQPKGRQPEGGVVLTIAIERDRTLSYEYVPKIGQGSLITGESKLEFVKADMQFLRKIYGNDSEIINQDYSHGDYFQHGQKAEDPFSVLFGLEDEIRSTMASIRNAGDTIDAAGSQVNQLVSDFRKIVNDTNTIGVANQAKESLEEFQLAIQDIRSLMNDPRLRKNLDESFDRLPAVLKDAQATLQTTQETVKTVGARLDEIGDATTRTVNAVERTVGGAEQTVKNIEQFTAPFAERSDDFAEALMTTLVDLDRTLLEAERFGQTLNQSDGTVRRLLEDDELYYQIIRTVQNVELASARLRPILDDVRVFSDKIARDPRQLGVRGALTKQPSGTGFK